MATKASHGDGKALGRVQMLLCVSCWVLLLLLLLLGWVFVFFLNQPVELYFDLLVLNKIKIGAIILSHSEHPSGFVFL